MIIDIRHQIPWQKRYISNTGTLLLWGFWILLWQPIAISLGLFDAQQRSLVEHLLNAFFMILEHGFTTLFICALSLWIWRHFIPSTTVKHSPQKNVQDYAAHFQLDVQRLHSARQQKVLTVFHDEQGKIQSIE